VVLGLTHYIFSFLHKQGVEISNSACTSCGESGGQLILCDGQNKKCNQEVHYHCADPPLSEADVAKLSSWFCRRCSARQAPPPKGHFPGFFGALMHNMDKQNTSAFSLPQDIKNRYAGVTAGPTGEYEERPELKNVSKKYDYIMFENFEQTGSCLLTFDSFSS